MSNFQGWYTTDAGMKIPVYQSAGQSWLEAVESSIKLAGGEPAQVIQHKENLEAARRKSRRAGIVSSAADVAEAVAKAPETISKGIVDSIVSNPTALILVVGSIVAAIYMYRS